MLLALAFSTLLAGVQAPSDAAVLDVLIVSGQNNHDCEWTAPQLAELLQETGRFRAEVTTEPAEALADAAALQRYAAVVLDYNGPRWGDAAEQAFMQAVRSGLGVAVIHAANNPFPGWAEYEEMVALCWRRGTGHGRFHAFDVEIIDRQHPITRAMDDLRAHPDELYHRLVPMHDSEYRLLAHALSSRESGGTGEYEPMVLVRQHGEGRVFHTPLGHVWRNQEATRASFLDPQFRLLVARGTEWAATGAVTLPATVPNRLSAEEQQAGFELLFDGRDPAAWRGYRRDAFPASGWQVEDGCLRHAAGGGGGDLVTREQFGDFELRFEWAVAEGANSGVIYRCTEAEDACWKTGPEFQVLDDGKAPRQQPISAGALYGLVAPQGVVLRPPGQFNTARIVVRGRAVEHWLNGVRVIETRMAGEDWERRLAASKFATMPGFAAAERGHIALQDHGDEVRYRTIRVRRLDGDR